MPNRRACRASPSSRLMVVRDAINRCYQNMVYESYKLKHIHPIIESRALHLGRSFNASDNPTSDPTTSTWDVPTDRKSSRVGAGSGRSTRQNATHREPSGPRNTF